MAHKKLWLGMWVIVFTFGMMVMGCEDNPQNSSPSFPAAKGKMTINGLEDFNGKYVYVQGLAGSSTVLTGLTDITDYPKDITYKLARISGDKTEVPLYAANSSATSYENSYIAYSGNDTITSINIIILDTDSLKSSNVASAINSNSGKKTVTSGTFSNGNITLDWGTIVGTWTPPEVNTSDIVQLTENTWYNFDIPSEKDAITWFTFIATESTQYIHKDMDLVGYSSNPIDSNGYGKSSTSDWDNTYWDRITSESFSLIPGQNYYIRCTRPSTSKKSCKIAFNKSNISPNWPLNKSITKLTQGQPVSVYMAIAGECLWFEFTATQSSHLFFVIDTVSHNHNLGIRYDLEIFGNDGNKIIYLNYQTFMSTDMEPIPYSLSTIPGQKYYFSLDGQLVYYGHAVTAQVKIE
jgi:hypothetical protein